MQVHVGNLPVWKGVQDNPGFDSLPFTFGIERGLIRLMLPETEVGEITEEYGKDSYNFITSPPGTSEWGNQLGDWYFDKLVEQVGNLSDKEVLEIGSGTLYIAEKMVEELGAKRVVAADPALRGESDLREVEVFRGYFNGQNFAGQSFDLVVSINNLEHIPDPFQYLKDVRHMLEARDGMFYVVVPDCTRALKSGDVGICVHEHLSYFTPESLKSVLGQCGLKADWIHSNEDTLFAIASPARVEDVGDSSEYSLELLRTFESRHQCNLESARQLIQQCREEGPLAIHGCSVGLNNILGVLNLRGDSNITLFDGDSNKAGKYLPAFGSPIQASTSQSYKNAHSVIIAALTYYDEISSWVAANHKVKADFIHPITPLLEE